MGQNQSEIDHKFWNCLEKNEQDVKSLKKLIECKADVNVKHHIFADYPLPYCIKLQKLEYIRILLENEVDTGIKINGVSCLSLACETDNTEIIKIILENIDDSLKNSHLTKSLNHCILNELHTSAKFLIENKADVNINSELPLFCPLNEAVLKNSNFMVKLLLENKADPNVDVFGIILNKAIEKNNYSIIQLLIEHGTVVDGRTHIHKAVNNNNVNTVDLLLKQGNIDVNEIDSRGKTCLSYAIIRENLEMMELLIKHKADVNKNYPLEQAYELFPGTRSNIMKLLLENKADPNLRTGNISLFHKSVSVGNYYVSDMLLEYKADIEDTNPLYFLSQTDNVRSVKYLIEKGANIKDVNLEKVKYEDVLNLLLKYEVEWPEDTSFFTRIVSKDISAINSFLEGKDSNHVLNNKDSLLIHAIRQNSLNAVKVLIERKANVNIVDVKESSVLEIAGNIGNPEILKILLENGAKFVINTTKNLNLAVKEGDIKKVLKFLKEGVKSDQNTLKIAAETKSEEMVQIISRAILGEEVEVEEENTQGRTLPSAPVEDEQEEGVVSL